jgi:hypothetical protein
MNSVTVHFVGICTHISQKTLPALPARQRVVLVNARHGHLVRETAITPHLPGLQIGDVQRELNGCTMRLVTSSAGLPLSFAESFGKLPNLTELVQALTTLGEPSPAVVLDANAEHSSCYFDIDFGTLSACVDKQGAAVVTLEVESVEPISLEIATWDGSPPEVIELPNGTVVWVGNVDQPAAAVEYPLRDFLLHYLTAAKMPHAPQVPQVPPADALTQCPFVHPFQTVGAGCSNSNYP